MKFCSILKAKDCRMDASWKNKAVCNLFYKQVLKVVELNSFIWLLFVGELLSTSLYFCLPGF